MLGSMSRSSKTQTAIIGAGPAGLIVAEVLAQGGASVARRERRGWGAHIHRLQRPGFPTSVQGLAAAARVAAAAQLHGRAVCAAPPLDRLGGRWTAVVSDP